MKRMNLKYAVILGLFCLSTSCSRRGAGDAALAWPPPPEKPKILYVSSIYGSQSLTRGFFGKLKDFLVGKSLTRDIATITFGKNILAQRFNVGSTQYLISDRGLDRHFEELARYQLS